MKTKILILSCSAALWVTGCQPQNTNTAPNVTTPTNQVAPMVDPVPASTNAVPQPPTLGEPKP